MNKKEDVYDNQIFPLMAQVIRICKENKINMAADFTLDYNEDTGHPLYCTTIVPADDDDEEGLGRLRAAYVLFAYGEKSNVDEYNDALAQAVIQGDN